MNKMHKYILIILILISIRMASANLSSDLMSQNEAVHNKALDQLTSSKYDIQKNAMFEVLSKFVKSFNDDYFKWRVDLDQRAFFVLEKLISTDAPNIKRILKDFKSSHPRQYNEINSTLYAIFSRRTQSPERRALAAYYLGLFDNEIKRATPEQVRKELLSYGMGHKNKSIHINSKRALLNMGMASDHVLIIEKLKERYILGEGDMAGSTIYAPWWASSHSCKNSNKDRPWKNEVGKIKPLLEGFLSYLEQKGLSAEEIEEQTLDDWCPIKKDESTFVISISSTYPSNPRGLDPQPITSASVIAEKNNSSWNLNEVHFTRKHQSDSGTMSCSLYDIDDLNSDGTTEIIFMCSVWEGAYLKVYTINSNGHYSLVYKGN